MAVGNAVGGQLWEPNRKLMKGLRQRGLLQREFQDGGRHPRARSWDSEEFDAQGKRSGSHASIVGPLGLLVREGAAREAGRSSPRPLAAKPCPCKKMWQTARGSWYTPDPHGSSEAHHEWNSNMLQTETPSPFKEAIRKICSGSQEAVFEFIEDYGPHIQRVVRTRLNHTLRAKFDSLDFVQMVWMTLFTDLNKISQFQRPDDLIAYLVVIARNKVIEESRRRTKYQKYNINREANLDATDPQLRSAAQRHETPSAQLIARERLDEVLNAKSERDRRIFDLRLEGATFVEIGAKLGISERTARQVMTDIETACYSDEALSPVQSL